MQYNKQIMLYILCVIFFILSVTFIILYVTSCKKSDGYFDGHLDWEHSDAAEQYDILAKKYGPPNYEDGRRGGIAIWTDDNPTVKETIFNRIELLDESVEHCVPYNHRDFLYSYVHYRVPEDKVFDVIKLSGSVVYDPLKHSLRARCGSEAANITTLYIATEIASGKKTIEEVQSKNLYKRAIGSISSNIASNWRNNVQHYYNKLEENVNNQKHGYPPKKMTHFPISFPCGCGKEYDSSGKCVDGYMYPRRRKYYYGHKGDKGNKDHHDGNKDHKGDKGNTDSSTHVDPV